jgi:hypothetical protein
MESTNSSASSLEKRPIRLLWGAAAAVCLLSVMRLLRVLPEYSCLDQASGVWTAMAIDLAHGVFYRPLISGAGYGGTRYFPLHFVIHAGLIKLGLDPIVAGCAIAIASAVALAAGIYVLLRRLDVPNNLAIPASVLPIVTEAGQMGLTMIRGDLLPAALTIWGLACVAKGFAEGEMSEDGRSDSVAERADTPPAHFPSLILPAFLFVLAFSAKSTSVFGPMAACAMLWLGGRKSPAMTLAAMVFVGAGAFIFATNWLSDGRFFAVLKACASADADMNTLLTAPVALLRLTLKADPSSCWRRRAGRCANCRRFSFSRRWRSRS